MAGNAMADLSKEIVSVLIFKLLENYKNTLKRSIGLNQNTDRHSLSKV